MLDGHHPVAPARELARQRHGQRGLSGVLPPDDGDDSRRRHMPSARARSSAVFTLKNRRSGSPKRATSDSGRIPTPDARMEADGAKVARVEARGDGVAGRRARRRRRAARRRAGRRSRAGTASCSRARRPARRSSAAETNGMSQATQTTGAGRLDHRGVDPAQRAEARAGCRAPPGGRAASRRRRARSPRAAAARPSAAVIAPHQPVQDPLAPDALQPLGLPAEPGGPAAGEDRAAYPGSRSVAPPSTPLEDHVDARSGR